jgi:radical SAM protein with 4Fe4S-binding SPASM domain
LRPNWDMVFCPSMDIPMANFIKEKSLRDAIKKKYKHDFYNIRISDIIKCKDCRYLKLCGSWCRVDAYYYLWDFKEPDPIACNLMPLIEKEIIPILPDNIKEYFWSLIRKDGGYPENYILDSILGNQ